MHEIDLLGEPRTYDPNDLIAKLVVRYNQFEIEDARSTKALHGWLGAVHENASKFGGPNGTSALIKAVRNHPDIKGKKAFKAEKKSRIELCLALSLGTKSNRGRKSNYLAALREAVQQEVATEEEAFASWIGEPGRGLAGAARAYRKRLAEAKPKPAANDPKPDRRPLLEVLGELPRGPETGTKITLSLPPGLEFPERVGILIIHEDSTSARTDAERTFVIDRAIADPSFIPDLVESAKDRVPFTGGTADGEYVGPIEPVELGADAPSMDEEAEAQKAEEGPPQEQQATDGDEAMEYFTRLVEGEAV